MTDTRDLVKRLRHSAECAVSHPGGLLHEAADALEAKSDVTDAMVEAAIEAVGESAWDWSQHDPMRRAIEAALTVKA